MYTTAAAVEVIAARLIDEHHPNLDGVEVRYLFRDKAAVAAGRAVLGRTRLVTGVDALLGSFNAAAKSTEDVEPFYVIEIALNIWEVLDDAQRRALVDHQLCHCAIVTRPDDDLARLGIRGHDLEEFRTVVERHGLWRTDVEDFAKAIAASSQLTFDDAGES